MTASDHHTPSLNWHHIASDGDELTSFYDDWADNYDKDMKQAYDYATPRRMVDLVSEYLTTDTRILDVGVGTGLVGELLFQRGFRDLTGIDFSAGMLRVARSKNMYRALRRETLGEPLGLPTAAFDAAISVGTFGPTHAPASGFDELVRVVKPGGVIAFTMRLDEFSERCAFGRKFAELESVGTWRLLGRSEPFRGLPGGRPEKLFLAFIFQVL